MCQNAFCGLCSAPGLAGGAYSALSDSLAGFGEEGIA